MDFFSLEKLLFKALNRPFIGAQYLNMGTEIAPSCPPVDYHESCRRISDPFWYL